MSIIDISELHKKFKSDIEKQQYMQAQYETIIDLTTKIKQKDEEIAHLKHLLGTTTPLIGQPQETLPTQKTEKIILSQEEALIDEQISIIAQRSYLKELSLEDIKKLDLLIKNKKLLSDSATTLKGDFKSINSNISKTDLIKIAQSYKPDGK